MNGLIINILMFGGISFFVFLLFLFMLKREKIIDQKFSAFEISLEGLNKEIYLIKKKLQNIQNLPKIEKIEGQIIDLIDNMEKIEEKNIEIINLVQERINDLYAKIKQNKISDISRDISKNEEDKIVELYKNGYSIEEISKELRIPAGEIELIVKFSDF